MSSLRVRLLLQSLRMKDVRLEAEAAPYPASPRRLHVDDPAGAVTDTLKASLIENKEDIIELLEKERTKLEEANRHGLVIRYSKVPGYIALHDPATGEWHDFPESSCLPGVVESARAASRKRRAEKVGKNGGAA